MKRLLIFFCTILLCGLTSATDINGTVTCDGEKYTASYTGAEAGSQYVLLVVEGTPDDYTVSQDSILYIDQVAADDNGTVTFSGFIPMSIADSVVLLGGYFPDGSPKVLGTIQSQYTLGDVNDDGRINGLDTTKLMRSLARLETLNDTQSKAADVNTDGRINGLDTTKLMRVLARLETLG